jgi:hypothetical protein
VLQSVPIQSDIFNIDKRATEEGKTLNKKRLVNKLNRLSFFKRPVILTFRQAGQNHAVSCDAIPHLCTEDLLICSWKHSGAYQQYLQSYKFDQLRILYKDKLLVAKPQLVFLDDTTIRLVLPENFTELNSRNVMRHACDGVELTIKHDKCIFSGKLLDFSATGFRAVVSVKGKDHRTCLLADTTGEVTLSTLASTIYSGTCQIVRKENQGASVLIVLSPVQSNLPVLKPKKYRSERVKPVPAPHICFIHPLIGKKVLLDVIEISGSGFTVNENVSEALLLPGLALPSLELKFSNLFSIQCDARVVHRKCLPGQRSNGSEVSCGIIFLDMDMQDHVKLVSYLQQAGDQRELVCHAPNMDALWDFFFDTGFIYPNKYAFFYEDRHKIKKTIEKLYQNPTKVSRHFIFQDKGVINGLIALQRVYKYTWMMHHFAARAEAKIAGPKVLRQIGSYMNDSFFLESNRMHYAIVYYRPENKFPSRVFGGVARNVKNSKICSLDTFAYLKIKKDAENREPLPDAWQMSETTQKDLAVLKDFYERISGGLMISAFDLSPGGDDDNELSIEYQKAGLTYRRTLFTLKIAGLPIAIIMVNRSDVGINLSDLTNCMHVFVLDSQALSKEILLSALSRLSYRFTQQWVAINIFPSDYAKQYSLKYEKKYTLWTYKVRYSDYYFGYLEKLSRFFIH